ncbi:MAG: hypothetical protein H6696_05490 [Deferribacteres bacterium]|nr:hypothetical protein [candidate division KSB1 bacterium]MCB9501371.1 hypothetical protein [Deferribacteres bacterium]
MFEEPTQKELSQIPKIGVVRKTKQTERIIHLRFSIGNCEWLVAGYDSKDKFYGFVDYHQIISKPKWETFSFVELKGKQINGIGVELDPYWKPVKFSERPIDLNEVELPTLTLSCGKCKKKHVVSLNLAFAHFVVYGATTPCCGKTGWFKDQETVDHIMALINSK